MMKRSVVVAIATLLVACSAPPVTEPGPAHPVIEHVARQEILTPLPMRVRLPSTTGAEHVVVLFRPWGARAWKHMELSRAGQTWSGEISCREVSTVTGDTKYFFLALDGEGDLVGGSGSPDWPHLATIVGSLPEGPQGLPGGSIPMRCHDPADCPPDFPGCPAYAMHRRACRSDRDCEASGDRCAWDGYCGSPEASSLAADDTAEEELEAAVQKVRRRYGATAKTKTPGRATP